jgi:iron complex transport system substrate-binding protein
MDKQRNICLLCYAAAIAFFLSACNGHPPGHQDAGSSDVPLTYQRIVSLSGGITETLFALGLGDRVVGIDITSTYPAELLGGIPRLGHVRNLNVEAVLGLQPDLIIVESGDAAATALPALAAAGPELMVLEEARTLAQPIARARLLARKLGGSAAALRALEQEHEQHLNELMKLKARQDFKPKVLFVYARGKGSMMVAGQGTPAAAMIDLAGGRNALTGFEGFRALSAEGLVDIEPDVLLLFDSGLESLGGLEGLLQVTGLRQTPAGKNRRIIAMDGLYLLGFTPRVAQAALSLCQALNAFEYEEQPSSTLSDL